MCGLAGLVARKDDSEIERRLSAMVGSLRHRGPDDGGIKITQPFRGGLGQTRLSIIDIEGGKQPFTDGATGNTIVYNGEVYNYKEIRDRLQKEGVRFLTNSDTEVILQAYQTYGIACLEAFVGMFAFAIYDTRNKHYFIAGDRFGIKPLYYYEGNKALIFASEIKAILASGLYNISINPANILMQLTYGHSIDNSTFLSSIKKLNPGEYMVFSEGNLSHDYYYDITSLPFSDKNITYKQAQEELRHLVCEAVKSHLIADVEVVSSLSGGLDSSIVTAIAAKEQAVHAISVNYNRPDDEVFYAEELAKFHKIQLHTEYVDVQQLNNRFHNLVYHLEEPIPHTQISTTYSVAALAGKKLNKKVCIVGEGADEVFFGYNFPQIANRPATRLFGNKFAYRKYKKMFFNLLTEGYGALNIFEDVYKYALEEFKEADYERFKKNSDAAQDTVHFIALCDIQQLLTNAQLIRVDKLFMAHSVEARVPYLDHRLVEYAWGLPLKYKLGPPEKKILRDTFKEILPASIYRRDKFGKSGTQNPFSTWWENGLKEKLTHNISKNILKRNIFKKDFIHQVLAGKVPAHEKTLLCLGMLEVFLNEVSQKNNINE